MKTIAFFNNHDGGGKSSLVYHLAWMYADLGLPVLAADLDPQANLTGLFLDENRLADLWPDGAHAQTIFGSLQPLLADLGDVAPPHVEPINEKLGLLAGDPGLHTAEDEFSDQWSRCPDRQPRAFRLLSAFWRIVEQAALAREAQLVLIDAGSSLGAISRAALLAAHHVVIPLTHDLYSLQGLKNLGPTLRRWRAEWQARRDHNPVSQLSIPPGEMTPAGYVMMQPALRLDRPASAHDRWMARFPAIYRQAVLNHPDDALPDSFAHDPHCLFTLKHYRSLRPLAQEARKPMFFLTLADGAIGGHAQAVQECYRDFRALARRIAQACGMQLP
jgi:cellulose biosynthesis protein BcsQ